MKSLSEMTLEELWALFPIILREHNPAYAAWYAEEAENLLSMLAGRGVTRISHIGSTAVRGLLAKPTVDILLEMERGYNAAAVIAALESDGWSVMAQNGEKRSVDLCKGYTSEGFADRVFHLHIKPEGDHGELYFRDYLNQHGDAANAYALLKMNLKERFEHDRDAYTAAKTDFVERHTRLAREEFGGRYLR